MVAIAKRKRPKGKPDPNRLTTREQLAKAFKASITTVANWLRKADFPGGSKGPWDRLEVETYLRRINSPLVKPADDAAAKEAREFAREMNREELLMRRARREQEEIRRDEIKRRLVPIAEVEARWAEACSFIRDQISMVPDNAMAVIPESLRPEVRQSLAHYINGVLRTLAKYKAEGAIPNA